MPEMIKLKLGDIDNYFVREAYRVLRTNILFCGPDIKTIVITSPLMNEGKTTVSLHLGASLAELGKRVLVMDTDMRKSVMAGRESNVKNVVGRNAHRAVCACICDISNADEQPQRNVCRSVSS